VHHTLHFCTCRTPLLREEIPNMRNVGLLQWRMRSIDRSRHIAKSVQTSPQYVITRRRRLNSCMYIHYMTFLWFAYSFDWQYYAGRYKDIKLY
jgi:hypothetical protein